MNHGVRANRPGVPRDRLLAWIFTGVPVLGLLLFFGYPLAVIGLRSILGHDGIPTLSHYRRLWTDPGLPKVMLHTLWVSGATMLLTTAAALAIAMALHRSRMKGKWLVRAVLMLPLLAPSLVQGLGLIFLLGRNGLVHKLTGLPTDIYGFTGLVAADVLYALPQAVLIISVALVRTDRRYYDAAESMGASAWRQFIDITLPQARLGLLSAAFVTFTITVTDFGNAMVVGGPYRVLATEIYNQVSGQMDFGMGATIGMLLLLPAILSLYIEHVASRQHGGSEHALPSEAPPGRGRDAALSAACIGLLLPVAAVLATVFYASFVKLWPYNLSLTLAHYHTNLPGGYTPILTSLKISIAVAAFGTTILFMLALGMRRLPPVLVRTVSFIATMPAAVPGMIIGIGYVLAFNHGPLSHWFYGSAAIVALCNFYHYHTQGFLTISTGLRTVPAALEDTAACFGALPFQSVRDAVLPFVSPALVSTFFLLFMQSMVTISAVIFLVMPDLALASVSVMQLNENGFISQAAAYSVCIVAVVASALGLMRLSTARIGIYLQQRRKPHVA